MSELNSRMYLATEAIVICFPLTALFFLRLLPAQVDHTLAFPEPRALMTLAVLVCLWRLMAAFIARGRAGLRRLSTYWWALPIAGAALAVQVAVDWWSVPVIRRSWLSEIVWGLPLLVPLLHLCAERWLISTAEPAIKMGVLPMGLRTRGGFPTATDASVDRRRGALAQRAR